MEDAEKSAPASHPLWKNIVIASFLAVLLVGIVFLISKIYSEDLPEEKSELPHIILILGDDLGWNDVSFNGSPQIPTPNIDALAASGIVLNKFYTAPQCTPSRASLMTGMYPSNTGLQHMALIAGQAVGLPLNFTIMPQYLKKRGYTTHAVGKWHLGFHRNAYTPTHRGFDSYFGSWTGEIDHFDYTHFSKLSALWGVDLHDGLKTVKNVRGRYAGDVFCEKAVQIIKDHNPLEPLFLYFSHVLPHSSNEYQPLQASPDHVAKFMDIKDIHRRLYAGAVSSLDESVGKLFGALHDKQMLQKSIIVFVSDNGAGVEGERNGYGSNWPLRGSKANLWEGAVRVPAVIWSSLFNLQEPRIYSQMMHLSDLLPTLYAAAGGNMSDLENVDGIDMWRHLVYDFPSPRKEILLQLDSIFGMSSIIQGDYKLVNGTLPVYTRNLWYGPSGRKLHKELNMDQLVWKNGSLVKDILVKSGMWILNDSYPWRESTTINCGSPSPPTGNGNCDASVFPCLFNITEDPCEYHNLASERPQVVKNLTDRIQELNSTSLEPLFSESDPNADPRCHGFAFVPWLEEEHAKDLCGLST